jgi:hypothetical protein
MGKLFVHDNSGISSAVMDQMEEQDWLSLMEQLKLQTSQQPLPIALVRLLHWPDLTRMPESMVPDVSRLCALLSISSAASHLVARRLRTSPENTAALIVLLKQSGCVEMLGADSEIEEFREVSARDSGIGAGTGEDEKTSLLSKIWNRLLSVK